MIVALLSSPQIYKPIDFKLSTASGLNVIIFLSIGKSDLHAFIVGRMLWPQSHMQMTGRYLLSKWEDNSELIYSCHFDCLKKRPSKEDSTQCGFCSQEIPMKTCRAYWPAVPKDYSPRISETKKCRGGGRNSNRWGGGGRDGGEASGGMELESQVLICHLANSLDVNSKRPDG